MDSGITPLTPQQKAKDAAEALAYRYWARVWVALDLFLNALANGRLGETISARAARAATQGKIWGKLLSHFLNLFDRTHGAGAMAGDLARAIVIVQLEQSDGTVPRA